MGYQAVYVMNVGNLYLSAKPEERANAIDYLCQSVLGNVVPCLGVSVLYSVIILFHLQDAECLSVLRYHYTADNEVKLVGGSDSNLARGNLYIRKQPSVSVGVRVDVLVIELLRTVRHYKRRHNHGRRNARRIRTA